MTERLAFRVSEVADMLGATATQVQRWIAQGELPATKIGGLWFVPADALRDRLEAYDVNRAGPQRGEPVPATAGRPVGRDGDDARRTPPVAVRRVEGRGAGASSRAATPARPGGAAGSTSRPRWTVPPEVAG